jgi:hypothetical protein
VDSSLRRIKGESGVENAGYLEKTFSSCIIFFVPSPLSLSLLCRVVVGIGFENIKRSHENPNQQLNDRQQIRVSSSFPYRCSKKNADCSTASLIFQRGCGKR